MSYRENKEDLLHHLIFLIDEGKHYKNIYNIQDEEFAKKYWENIKKVLKGPGNGLRVIFLDIDGVLNNATTYHKKKHKSKWFDEYNVHCLNTLIEDTGAVVVISSSWRKSETKESLLEKMREGGYKHDIYDFTPSMQNKYIRGNEIKEWMDTHNQEVESYVILDDDSDMLLWQRDNFVWIDYYTGLTENMALKARHILLNRQAGDCNYYGT